MKQGKLLTIGRAAKMVGRKPRTLRSWTDKQWLLDRRLNGRRVFYEHELVEFMRERGLQVELSLQVAIYARVSTSEQAKEGDLERQIKRLVSASGSPEILVCKDIASGLSEKRAGLKRLYALARARKINTVYIEHKDRLARFGYGYLEEFFTSQGVKIVITGTDISLNNSDTPEETELVRDMISILTSFSGRLHGARGLATQKLKKELENNE